MSRSGHIARLFGSIPSLSLAPISPLSNRIAELPTAAGQHSSNFPERSGASHCLVIRQLWRAWRTSVEQNDKNALPLRTPKSLCLRLRLARFSFVCWSLCLARQIAFSAAVRARFGSAIITRSYIPADLGERPKLPGPLAKGLNHAMLTRVLSESYQVCEKSDGERRMLLSVCDSRKYVDTIELWQRFAQFYFSQRNAWLIDRSFDVKRVVDGDVIGGMMSPEPGTASLLDGELLDRPAGHCASEASKIYIIFDCINWCNEAVGELPLTERIKRIGAARMKFKEAQYYCQRDGKPMPSVRILICALPAAVFDIKQN